MDDKKIGQLLQNFSNTSEDQEARTASQNSAVDEARRAMLTPEQRAFEDYQLTHQTFQPQGMVPQPTPSPEQQVLMEKSAMTNYNSPEAQALRAKYSDQPQGSNVNLAEIAGLLKQTPRLRKPSSD